MVVSKLVFTCCQGTSLFPFTPITMYNVLFNFYSRVKYLNLFQQISILNSYILIQISLYPIESFDVPVHVFWKIQLEFPILQKKWQLWPLLWASATTVFDEHSLVKKIKIGVGIGGGGGLGWCYIRYVNLNSDQTNLLILFMLIANLFP